VGATVDGTLLSCVGAESKFNVRAIMLTEFSVALGANVQSPAPTAPLVMDTARKATTILWRFRRNLRNMLEVGEMRPG
jgi:hypothetical protein